MMKKKLKAVFGALQWFLIIILVLVVSLLVFTAFNPVKSFQILRVMSGSMEPKIKVGSVVFVKRVKSEILKENDVITYASLEDPNISITHRLVEIEKEEGKTVFRTQGDANNSQDAAEIFSSQIEGKVLFSLPFLGYLSVWIRKPLGFGLLIILPALLIIISEILNIKKTIEKEVEKKYAKREKRKKSKSINLLLIFFLIGIGFFQIKPTNAYFFDVVVSEGNTFLMGWWDENIVINEVYYDVDSAHQKAGTENRNEWIELYNNGPGTVDISGWTIEDNGPIVTVDVIPPTLPIAPGTFIVITPHSSTWDYWNIPEGADRVILASTDKKIGNGLNNQGDRVILKDRDGNVIDEMSYGNDNSIWDPDCLDVTTGHSLARISKGYDTDQASDFVDNPIPNPGTNPHISLNFYFQLDKAAVGFEVVGIEEYQKLSYEIFYQTDIGQEGIMGTIELEGENEIIREDFTLGTCSTGGSCVYHSGIDVIHLKIILENNEEKKVLEKELDNLP